MLRDEILEILDLFDKYKLSEEDQRRIFKEGIYFDFTYGDPDPCHKNRHLDVFGVGTLLKTCKENHIRINIKKLIHEPWLFPDEDLIREVADYGGRHKRRVRRLGNDD